MESAFLHFLLTHFMNLSMVSYFDSTTKSAQLRVSLQEAPQREKKTSPNGQLYFLFRNLLRLRTTSYLDSRHDGYFIVTSAITIFHSSIPFGNPISHSQTAAVYARGSSTGCNNFRFRCTSNLYDILFLV